MSRKIGWMLVGIFCLVLVPIRAGAQETQWKKHMAAAAKAHQQGHYGDAEKSFKAALKEAEHFEPQDTRLAIVLNNLAELYRLQAKYTKAEPLYKQSLAIMEEALGPGHPNVATTLNSLAELYRDQGQYDEAEPLYKRALAIRGHHKGSGPRGRTRADKSDLLRFFPLIARHERRTEMANSMRSGEECRGCSDAEPWKMGPLGKEIYPSLPARPLQVHVIAHYRIDSPQNEDPVESALSGICLGLSKGGRYRAGRRILGLSLDQRRKAVPMILSGFPLASRRHLFSDQ